MSDVDLQVLLDPDYKLTRTQYNVAKTTDTHYVTGRTLGHSRSGWVTVTTLDADATKDTAIRAALAQT